MMKSRKRLGMPAGACLVTWFVCLAVMPAGAAEPLAPVVKRMIESAAARDAEAGGKAYLEAAVILALDAGAGSADEIAAVLRGIAPDRAPAVLALVAATGALVVVAEPAVAPEPEPDPPSGLGGRFGLEGEVQAGGTLTSGNIDERALNTAFKLRYEGDRWSHHAGVVFDFTRTQGATTKQRLIADYQLDYKFSNRAFVYGFVQYEDQRFSGFEFRTAESVGLGYHLIARERFNLKVEGGPALRQDKIEMTGGIENEFGGRLNAAFEWQIWETSVFTQEAAFFAGSERSTFTSTTALKVKISDKLAGKISYNLQWDSNVPADRASLDTVTRLTLVYDF